MPRIFWYTMRMGSTSRSVMGFLYPSHATSLKCDEKQGPTLVHCSAQREHFLSHVVWCFAGFSDKNGSG